MASQGDSAKGLFAGLFDFNFTTFITMKFIKVIYALALVLILLGGIIAFFASLASGGAGGIFTAFIIVPIGVLLYLIFARVYMEVIALFFRIGENTQAIRQSLSGPAAAQPFGSYSPPTGPGAGPMGAPPQPQQPPQQPPSWAPQQPQQPPRPPQPPQQPGFPPPAQ